MKRLGMAVLTAACILGAPWAQAAEGLDDFWVSLGAGYYGAKDYRPDPGQPKGDAQNIGGFEGVLAMSYAGPVLLRLRGAWMTEFTSNTAEDVSGLIGIPAVPGRMYFAAGVSRLTDVSNQKQTPTVGVPVEMLLYPTRGMELSIHANFNDDRNFIGITLAGVFGKKRVESSH